MSLQSHLRLPVELYQPIFADIPDRRDLLSLVSASKLFKKEVEPFLYRNLHLMVYDQELYRSHKLLLDRLGSSPHLVGYVYSLKLFIDPFAFSSAQKAFQAMRNLKKLHIFSPSDSASISQLIHIPPFQLHHFSCSLQVDAAFTAFIRAQPGINTLMLNPPGDPELGDRLSQRNFPSLKVLASNPFAIGNLLPGSNITCLHCDGNDHLFHMLLPRDLVINTLRSFNGFDPNHLDLVSRMFPNLKFLEGWTNTMDTLGFSFNQFKHLKKLKIHLRQWVDMDRETCVTYATRIFNSSNTVDTIEIFGRDHCWKGSRSMIDAHWSENMDSRRDEWMEWK